VRDSLFAGNAARLYRFREKAEGRSG
jgi:hypothetical protein